MLCDAWALFRDAFKSNICCNVTLPCRRRHVTIYTQPRAAAAAARSPPPNAYMSLRKSSSGAGDGGFSWAWWLAGGANAVAVGGAIYTHGASQKELEHVKAELGKFETLKSDTASQVAKALGNEKEVLDAKMKAEQKGVQAEIWASRFVLGCCGLTVTLLGGITWTAVTALKK